MTGSKPHGSGLPRGTTTRSHTPCPLSRGLDPEDTAGEDRHTSLPLWCSHKKPVGKEACGSHGPPLPEGNPWAMGELRGRQGLSLGRFL